MKDSNTIDLMSKKDEILLITDKFNPQIVSNSEHFLEIRITSNYGEELWISIESEFSIFFGDWHAHYFACIEEYEHFIDDLLGILENRKYTICSYNKDEWCGSVLSENDIIDYDTIEADFGKEKTIKCNYWDKSKNITIKS